MDNPLPTATACEQLVPERPRRSDPAGDRAPALLAASVLEADFVHARGAPIDVALDADSARGGAVFGHVSHLYAA